VSGEPGAADAASQPVADIQAVREAPDHAVGDGGGIVLVATTSTGCLLGARHCAA
jgi:hypothetical protein